VASLLLLAACEADPLGMPGTLEYDQITVPATASEPLRELLVHEGAVVTAGAVLMRFDTARLAARHAAAMAQADHAREVLRALVAGARRESRAEALARVQAAEAVAGNAAQQFERVRALVARGVLPAAQLDTAEAARREAAAQVAAARAASDVLAHGSRREDIAAARAGLRAAEAAAADVAVDLARLEVRSPRAGRIDSLPVLLVGPLPYARIYVPAPLLAAAKVGATLKVLVEGQRQPLLGRVRAVRSEPTFTPYYALSGEDAARLAYLAEIQLDAAAAGLPAGLPLRAVTVSP
jgi:HlyD family secretion protein